MNLNGARLVCQQLGIKDQDFYHAISSFEGAARRLEIVKSLPDAVMFRDFAHSPSKLRATTAAVKRQFPDRKIIACMELHTFSSLNKDFLDEYRDCMALADHAFVYFNPHTIAHKKLEPISAEEVRKAFGGSALEVLTESSSLTEKLHQFSYHNSVLLMMSSGTFDGIDLKQLADELFASL